MATLKLNIYERQADGTTQLAKTYEAEGGNLMLGTLQDIMAVIDLDRVSEANEIELAKMALRLVGQINPILLDFFPGGDVDVRPVIQHPADGGHRDPGHGRDIFDCIDFHGRYPFRIPSSDVFRKR